MQRISLQDAQTDLRELIDAALQGETVLIFGDNEQVVQLVPVKADKQPRKAGSAKGRIRFADDYDAPVPDFSEYLE